MTTETNIQTQNMNQTSDRLSGAETVVGWAVFGCLTAGGVGILKALSMENASDVLLCLLGSATAFGMVLYLYVRKS